MKITRKCYYKIFWYVIVAINFFECFRSVKINRVKNPRAKLGLTDGHWSAKVACARSLNIVAFELKLPSDLCVP